MKFAYKEVPLDPSPAFPKRAREFRPIIPVSIGYEEKKIGYEALIDSGADWNLFPAVIGEIIGINISSGKECKFGGIGGGQYLAYFHNVTLYIGGHPIEVFCGFSPDIPPAVSSGVLGHFGFFDHFAVKFETTRHMVEIKKV